MHSVSSVWLFALFFILFCTASGDGRAMKIFWVIALAGFGLLAIGGEFVLAARILGAMLVAWLAKNFLNFIFEVLKILVRKTKFYF